MDAETGRLIQLAKALPDAAEAAQLAQAKADECYQAVASLRSRFPQWERLNEQRRLLRLAVDDHPERKHELDAMDLEIEQVMSECLNSLST